MYLDALLKIKDDYDSTLSLRRFIIFDNDFNLSIKLIDHAEKAFVDLVL